MQKLFELWNKIPREKEWWLDQVAKFFTGCATGCFTFILCYVVAIVGSIGASIMVADNFNEALWMGLAWGVVTGTLTLFVGGSGGLAVYSWLRGS